MTCINQTNHADNENEKLGGGKVCNSRLPVPAYKPALIVCKSRDGFSQSYKHVPKLERAGNLPAPYSIYKDMVVCGEVTAEHRAKFNVIDYDPNAPADYYTSLIQSEADKYNQQVSILSAEIAKELPDFSLNLSKSEYDGLMRAEFNYAKDYSPKRKSKNIVPRRVLNCSKAIEPQIAELKMATAIFEKENELMAQYPHLFIRLYPDGSGMSLWMRGETADGEAFDRTGINRDVLERDGLEKVNEECGKARQPGMFYCTLCGTAQPNSEYLTFNMTSNGCKSCGKKNPAWVKQAASETYN